MGNKLKLPADKSGQYVVLLIIKVIEVINVFVMIHTQWAFRDI